jgi:K+-sensing histidine kinase KdpD
VGANFKSGNGVDQRNLARLSQDGLVDESFRPNVNGNLWVIHEEPNGSLLIGGSFITVNGISLVFNAIKFSKKGAEIVLRAAETDQGLQIDVIDSGVGIPPETISKLFRIDTNTSRQGTEGETGTGLGLVICKEFIEKHEGRIWAESELGKGSVFSFTLPEK